ncbi:MAG: hypothetical protein S4CHLAM7_13890 [Chlamydiae bacterium]|nr:hypothetical protein [Chlamydiota bacterium]
MKKSLWLLVLVFTLSSCGYQLTKVGHGSLKTKTISVPYVEGDQKGDFTSTLIHNLAASGQWSYTDDEGEFTLNVTLLAIRDEEVGYNYAIQNGQVNKWLVPNENNLSALALVELIETSSGETVIGPNYLSANVIYDYDPNFNVDNLVRFSLAQYNFQQIAARTAKIPLEERLSKAIIEYINNSW